MAICAPAAVPNRGACVACILFVYSIDFCANKVWAIRKMVVTKTAPRRYLDRRQPVASLLSCWLRGSRNSDPSAAPSVESQDQQKTCHISCPNRDESHTFVQNPAQGLQAVGSFALVVTFHRPGGQQISSSEAILEESRSGNNSSCACFFLTAEPISIYGIH